METIVFCRVPPFRSIIRIRHYFEDENHLTVMDNSHILSRQPELHRRMYELQ